MKSEVRISAITMAGITVAATTEITIQAEMLISELPLGTVQVIGENDKKSVYLLTLDKRGVARLKPVGAVDESDPIELSGVTK